MKIHFSIQKLKQLWSEIWNSRIQVQVRNRNLMQLLKPVTKNLNLYFFPFIAFSGPVDFTHFKLSSNPPFQTCIKSLHSSRLLSNCLLLFRYWLSHFTTFQDYFRLFLKPLKILQLLSSGSLHPQKSELENLMFPDFFYHGPTTSI